MAGEQKELEPQKPHILLVEDEPLPFHEFLKISGYQVTQAKNGQEVPKVWLCQSIGAGVKLVKVLWLIIMVMYVIMELAGD